MKLISFFTLLFLKILGIQCTHIRGTWNTEDFFMILLKFGFVKTDPHDPSLTGYVYGNITTNHVKFNKTAAFVLIDDEQFVDYYRTYRYRVLQSKDEACQQMFAKFNFGKCDSEYLKRVNFIGDIPCGKNQLCTNTTDHVLGSQYTFRIDELKYPQYWYASFVACYHNPKTCTWHHLRDKVKINYDLWFVNGNPNRSSFNPFTYQFSFDKHDTVEFYLLFFVIYALLVPVQIYAVTRQSHPVTKLFTTSLMFEFLGVSLNLLNSLKFAVDGVGYSRIGVIGDVLDILSRTTFMLLLLLLAKGWAVTRIQLTWHPFVFFIWLLYGLVHILLYIWNQTEVDIVEEVDEYQTWPGYLILSLRLVIIFWFLLELRNTMRYEHNKRKLNFFLHFGASALVWFIYLPIVALVALEVPSLWRYKLLLGITYAADGLAYCIMTHLLWPTRSEQYFLLTTSTDSGNDELDVYNEAPHILNSQGTSPTEPESPQIVKLIDLNVYT